MLVKRQHQLKYVAGFNIEAQHWYNRDKGTELQKELIEIFVAFNYIASPTVTAKKETGMPYISKVCNVPCLSASGSTSVYSSIFSEVSVVRRFDCHAIIPVFSIT